MSVWELYTQLFARNWRCGRFARSLSQGCSKKIKKKDVIMTAGRWSSCINSDPAILDALVTCDESWIYCYDPETTRQSSQWKHASCPWLKRPDRANPPTNFWWSLFFFWQHWHDLHALGSHWPDNQQGILRWGFKGVPEEIPWEEASTLQIGSVAFPLGQWTSLQLHPCHRLFDQDGHQDSLSPFHPPYSPDLVLCDFWLFPKLKEKLTGCRYETIKEMKEAVTKVIDTFTQEDIRGAFQKLLERYKCIASGGDYLEGD